MQDYTKHVVSENGTERVLYIDIAGSASRVNEVHSLTSFYLRLCRQFKLLGNERVTILSSNDQLVALQLCMAYDNKQKSGDMNIEVSKVLVANDRIIRHKCHPSDECDEETKTILESFTTFLKDCNYCDLVDVYLVIKNALTNDTKSPELVEFLRGKKLVFVGRPRTDLQRLMLKALCENRDVYTLTTSGDSVNIEPSSLTHWIDPETTNDGVITSPCSAVKTPAKSISETHVTSTLMAYMELLVNSRSELALARSVNSPDRDLNHAAFTAIKRAARDKHMPMYQLILSHIMRVRLGGKGYQPDPQSALMQHVKGLGTFTDLVHRLQTIIEEFTDTVQACTKVINMLRALFIKATTSVMRPASVNKVADSLIASISNLVSSSSRDQFISPAKSIGDGGSQVGRHTLRVLRDLCDLHTVTSSSLTSSLLDDVITSQQTPVRLPSLLSQFRSPEDVDSPDSKLTKTLASRVVADAKNNQPKVNGRKAGYDWAPTVNAFSNDDDCLTPSRIIVAPSKTMMVSGREGKSPLAMAMPSPSQDQENIGVTNMQNSTKPAKDLQITEQPNKKRRNLCDATNQIQSKKTKVGEKNVVEKRAKDSEQNTDENTTKNNVVENKKPGKKADKKPKSCRRKLDIAQVKGQQSLMKFFR